MVRIDLDILPYLFLIFLKHGPLVLMVVVLLVYYVIFSHYSI